MKDELLNGLSGVLCWRVFVHFTPEDIAAVLQRIYTTLLPKGRLVFNVIDKETHGRSEQWVDFEGDYKMGTERYYAYYSKDEIEKIIKKNKS